MSVLGDDLVRAIARRLSLWDARSLQRAHPSFKRVVAEHVEGIVARVVRAPRPALLDAWLDVPPGFSQRVHGAFALLRTPRDATVYYAYKGVVVVARARDGPPRARGRIERARVELRMPAEPTRPTFDTLERVLAAIWWFTTALRERGCDTIQYHTRALVHHPVSEVLNTAATTFVERACGQRAERGPPLFGLTV